MRTRLTLALLAAAVLAVAFFHSRLTRACGPFFPQIIFINTLHPDLPIGPYSTGNLGVIQPTYSDIYLYVAYRHLAGRHISPAEVSALWDNDQRLLASRPMWSGDFLQKQQAQQAEAHTDWARKWASATGQSLGGARDQYGFDVEYPLWAGIYNKLAIHDSGTVYYNQYLNCPQDAFRSALTTLQQLREQFGETSSIVEDWSQAQQKVFANCSGGMAIPDALAANAPAIARQARAYQIAAAYFYSGGYEQAATDFRAVAQDKSSPWSTIAPYLVARSLVRKATMVEKSEPDLAALAQAEAEVNSVLSNPQYAKYHDAAERLQGFIEFRLHPAERMVELANHMTKFSGDQDLAQDATDFKMLFPRVVNMLLYPAQPNNAGKSMTLADVRANSDLLDWMLTLRQGGSEAYAHSFEKWKSTHSEAWLVEALMEAAPDSPQLSELLAAAKQVSPASHAYDSLTFYSMRLMLRQGKDGAVRERLASMDLHQRLPSGFTMPPSAVNLFLALRFKLARNPASLFANAARVPALVADPSEPGDMPWAPYPGYKGPVFSSPHFDDDALVVLNRFLPVGMLVKAVQGTALPEGLRHEIALAAWTRAALIGDTTVTRQLAPLVETFEPELKSDLRSYNSATTTSARRFAVVLTALRFPGLSPFITTPERGIPLAQIDDFRNNWWGTEGPQCTPPYLYSHIGQPGYQPLPHWPQIDPALQTIYPGGMMKPPEFLNVTEQTEAAREWQRLMGMSPAPDYLAAEAVAWAKADPSDPRVPEALALAVKTTRFGCVDPKTGGLSKAAYDLLHSRYPQSAWTDKTKYWFKM